MSVLRFLSNDTPSAGLGANAVATVFADSGTIPLAAGQSLRITCASLEVTCAGSDLTIQRLGAMRLTLNFYSSDQLADWLDAVNFASENCDLPTGANQAIAHGAVLAWSHDDGVKVNFSGAQLPQGTTHFSIGGQLDVKNGATAGRVVTCALRALVYY